MEQVHELLKRFRCSPPVREKAEEYFRLVELKRNRGIQPSCLAAICVELACHQCKEPIDKKQFQCYSGLHMKHYVNFYQIVEKQLKIQSRTTLKDLSIRLSMPEIEIPSREILENYQKYLQTKCNSTQYESIDFTSPLYVTAALYTACKILKKRCDKSQLIIIACVKKSTFNNVLQDMQRNAPQTLSAKLSIKEKKVKEQLVDKDSEPDHEDNDEIIGGDFDIISHLKTKSFEGRCLSNPLSEDYLKWKKRILNNT